MLSNIICNSLCHEMYYPAPNHPTHIAHYPYEGVIIALIICITLVVLMIIIRGMILKIKDNESHAGKTEEQNQSLREHEVNLKTRNDLISKLLTFEEKLAKDGSQRPDEEARYRNTIICLLKKYCELGEALDSTAE